MKRIIILLILLLSISYINAEEGYTTVFDQEVKDAKIITADQKSFTVIPISLERVKISFPNGKNSIIPPGDCVFEGNYNACVLNIRYGDDNEFNISTQKYPIYTKLKIEKPLTQGAITRTFSKKKFYVGEVINVQVMLENKGGKAITAEYFESEPKEIIITEAFGCTAEGNRIKWYGSISKEIPQRFSYSIKALSPFRSESNATLVYNNQNTSVSDEIEAEIPDTLKTITNFTSQELNLGQELYISISCFVLPMGNIGFNFISST